MGLLVCTHTCVWVPFKILHNPTHPIRPQAPILQHQMPQASSVLAKWNLCCCLNVKPLASPLLMPFSLLWGLFIPFHTEIFYWYFKGQLQCHLVCEHSLRTSSTLDLHPMSSPFRHMPSALVHDLWMALSVCLSILSQLHLYFTYFKLLQSKGGVSYFPISFPTPPQLAPCASKEQVSQADLLNDDWLYWLIDWLDWMKHIYISVLQL